MCSSFKRIVLIDGNGHLLLMHIMRAILQEWKLRKTATIQYVFLVYGGTLLI